VTLVVDASALLDFVLNTGRASGLGPLMSADEMSLHVPALCDVEVVAAIRRWLVTGRLSVPRAQEAIMDYLDLPVIQHGHSLLLGRMLRLRANFSAYDAAYVALAEHLEAELFTTDHALARAVRGHTGVMVRT
jgi:predicted nucleic acid-binding protein